MIYDYNHYNDPKKGNKHIYAFGERYEHRVLRIYTCRYQKTSTNCT